jgi:hypothetical protein
MKILLGIVALNVSQLRQKQFTTEKFDQAFKSVLDSGLNRAALEALDPIMAGEPKIDENGVLLLAGYYPAKPQVHFEQKYIYEGLSWKLLGFKIQTK